MDLIEELAALLEEADARVCFWFGAPPCPKCGGEHDPNGVDSRLDAQIRLAYERGHQDSREFKHWCREHLAICSSRFDDWLDLWDKRNGTRTSFLRGGLGQLTRDMGQLNKL